MKKLKYASIPVLLLAGIIAILFYNKSKIEAKATKSGIDFFYVSTQKVGQEKISEDISLVGTVTANNDVSIVSETQGKVTAINTKIGDYKSSGSILIQVDDELKKAALMSAEANYEKSKKDYERFQTLYKQNATTDAQLDAAKLQYSSAEANYIIAKRQYNDTKITTPISGVVTARNVDVGSMIQPGMVVANVVDISKLKVKVNVAESDAFKLQVGDKIDVTTDVYPGVTFNGRVETISSKADESHTYPVEIVIVNESNHPLKAGMFARINFATLAGKETIVIPRAALVGSVKNPKVFVVKNGTAKERDIVLGQAAGTNVQVLGGLMIGETIVTNGQNNLTDGAKVQVQ